MGILFLGYAAWQPAVFITVDERAPIFNPPTSYPAAVDPGAPSVITQMPGDSNFWVVVRDAGPGTDEGSGIVSGTVQCVSTTSDYDSGLMPLAYSRELTITGTAWEVWTWSAPMLPDSQLYTFLWYFTDKADNVGQLITYGGYGEADGYFIVNGITIASATQTIYLNTRTIDVKFIGTDAINRINGITVKVRTDTGFVLRAEEIPPVGEGVWEALDFYTFIDDGSYTVEGYIDEPTKSIMKMSFIQQVGDTTPKEGFSIFRIGAGVLGFVLFIVALRSDQENE